MKLLIVGAGWAGLAAAVRATQAGHQATVVEASRAAGGRARAAFAHADQALDNGQHILIAAYSETLALMRAVGLDPYDHLLPQPLCLRTPDGSGLALPRWRKPWFRGADFLAGVLAARGWGWGDKLALLRAATAWQRAGFSCPASMTVAQLCAGLPPRVMQGLIDPLVVSALNTPSEHASAQVFLRVLHDANFALSTQAWPGSTLLLPRVDLGALFPQPAIAWLAGRGCQVLHGLRLESLEALTPTPTAAAPGPRWRAHAQGWAQDFEAVLLATPPWENARLLRTSAVQAPAWLAATEGLRYEAIATVYAHAPGARLPRPLLALRSSTQAPAQFVFDRGQLTGQAGLLALVVSASQGDAATLERQVLAQAQDQLGLDNLQAVKTVVEKRATFACTPGLQRPGIHIAPGLLACGDYIAGPYPATLEGALRSASAAVHALGVA